MGSILSSVNYMFELIFDSFTPTNRVCSTSYKSSNYYNNYRLESYFLTASPVPVLEELSIEELCYVHGMKKEEIMYELEFGSI